MTSANEAHGHQLDNLLDQLWRQYVNDNPQAAAIHQLLADRGEKVENDHIAFRTFDDERINLAVLASSFERLGYRACGDYAFPEKKLNAKHYEHADKARPRVFISELKLAEVSPEARRVIGKLIDAAPANVFLGDDLPMVGRPWPVSWADYETLAAESEYAAWLAAFGFRANHFTVAAHALKSFASLAELNTSLQGAGFELNAAGGLIKGSPDEGLEQSSTRAAPANVAFSGGVHEIPCCYYEFAWRHPDAAGRLFSGFIAKSANRIFESTDRS